MLVFKLIIMLAVLGSSRPGGEAQKVGGWQGKGGVVCVWTKGPDGSAACVCRRV